MIKRNSIKLDNCEISYIQSREDGIPVLLLHELSLGAITFQDIIKSKLGDKYRLIAFDLPGHGESAYSDNPIEDYSLPGLAGTLGKVARHLHAENAILIGNGLGGNIIIEALNDLPWVRGICFFGTPIISNKNDVKKIFYKHPIYDKFFNGQLNEDSLDEVVKTYSKNSFHTELKELIKKSDYRFRKYFGNWIKAGEFINYKEYLRYNEIPLAVFHGTDDELIDYAVISKIKIQNLWKNKIQLIDYASHLPQIENPKKLNRLIEEFINIITGIL